MTTLTGAFTTEDYSAGIVVLFLLCRFCQSTGPIQKLFFLLPGSHLEIHIEIKASFKYQNYPVMTEVPLFKGWALKFVVYSRCSIRVNLMDLMVLKGGAL